MHCRLHADPLMSKQRVIFMTRTQIDRGEATGSQERAVELGERQPWVRLMLISGAEF